MQQRTTSQIKANLVPKRKEVDEKRQVSDAARRWLLDLVAERDLTVPTFAKALGWPEHHFHKMLHERKNWTAEEAAAVAAKLEISVLELLRRFGIPLLERKTPVEGTVRANGRVSEAKGPVKETWPPAHADPHTRALYVANNVEGFGLVERSYVFYQESSLVVDSAWGRLCLIRPIGDGVGPYLGVLSRASQAVHIRGQIPTLEVHTASGKTVSELVGSALPITWQRFS